MNLNRMLIGLVFLLLIVVQTYGYGASNKIPRDAQRVYIDGSYILMRRQCKDDGFDVLGSVHGKHMFLLRSIGRHRVMIDVYDGGKLLYSRLIPK